MRTQTPDFLTPLYSPLAIASSFFTHSCEKQRFGPKTSVYLPRFKHSFLYPFNTQKLGRRRSQSSQQVLGCQPISELYAGNYAIANKQYVQWLFVHTEINQPLLVAGCSWFGLLLNYCYMHETEFCSGLKINSRSLFNIQKNIFKAQNNLSGWVMCPTMCLCIF